jgi:hypothetical protein
VTGHAHVLVLALAAVMVIAIVASGTLAAAELLPRRSRQAPPPKAPDSGGLDAPAGTPLDVHPPVVRRLRARAECASVTGRNVARMGAALAAGDASATPIPEADTQPSADRREDSVPPETWTARFPPSRQ